MVTSKEGGGGEGSDEGDTKPSAKPGTKPSTRPSTRPSTKGKGDAAQARARRWLERQGMVIVAENYLVARGPHARGGEIDLIATDTDGTLVFVEVRSRAHAQHGGAAATVSPAKRRRIVWAAQHYLQGWRRLPPCRFDVVAIDGDELAWLPGAFDTTSR